MRKTNLEACYFFLPGSDAAVPDCPESFMVEVDIDTIRRDTKREGDCTMGLSHSCTQPEDKNRSIK